MESILYNIFNNLKKCHYINQRKVSSAQCLLISQMKFGTFILLGTIKLTDTIESQDLELRWSRLLLDFYSLSVNVMNMANTLFSS